MEHSTTDLIAIVKQATEPINENISLMRTTVFDLVVKLMDKDDQQQTEIDVLKRDFSRGEDVLEEICNRIKTMETSMMSIASSIPPVIEVNTLSKNITKLSEELEELKKHVPFIKAMRWVVGVLVGLMLTTIWMLITGMQGLVNISPP